MRFPRVLAVVPLLLLAGCTQIDAAREQLDEARQELDEARQRYDRVRSLTAIRQEVLDVDLAPRLDAEGHVSFQVNASRGGVAIPGANLTALAPVAVRVAGSPWILCDPLTCAVQVPDGRSVEVRASPESSDALVAGRSGSALDCAPGPCALRLTGVRGWVTTSMGDATD